MKHHLSCTEFNHVQQNLSNTKSQKILKQLTP